MFETSEQVKISQRGGHQKHYPRMKEKKVSCTLSKFPSYAVLAPKSIMRLESV